MDTKSWSLILFNKDFAYCFFFSFLSVIFCRSENHCTSILISFLRSLPITPVFGSANWWGKVLSKFLNMSKYSQECVVSKINVFIIFFKSKFFGKWTQYGLQDVFLRICYRRTPRHLFHQTGKLYCSYILSLNFEFTCFGGAKSHIILFSLNTNIILSSFLSHILRPIHRLRPMCWSRMYGLIHRVTTIVGQVWFCTISKIG